MSNYKTGKEYRKELDEIERSERKLRAVVSERLLELATKYPDVTLPSGLAWEVKSKDVANKYIIMDLKLSYMIMYIETIEKTLEEQHPHKQLKIKF